MRLSQFLSEVKDRPVPEGMPDPALMTYQEYEKVANPSNKSHSSDAYQMAGGLDYHRYNEFTPLRRFKSRGIEFEMKIKREDRYERKYIKQGPGGKPVTDEQGNFVYMTLDELAASGMARYEYTIAVFHDQVAVAAAQDEWGALLIVVVQEYQGFGLGPILGQVARKMDPYADSGGFTPGGQRNLEKVHREFVREYMQSGMYSHLVRTGQITAERAKEIIASANIDVKPTKRPDVGPSGKKMFWTNDTNAWIVYDQNLPNVIDQIGGDQELFASKLIHAYAFIVGEDPTYLYELDYNDKQSGKIVLEAAIAETESHGDELRIRNDNWTETWERVRALGYDVGIDEPFPESEVPPHVFNQLSQYEREWRKSFDTYGEFEILMQELADKVYNQ